MLAIAAVGIFAFGYHWGNRYARPKAENLSAYVFVDPVKIRPFTLLDEQGRSFSSDSFQDHWNLIMAGRLDAPGCQRLLVRYVLAWNNLAQDAKMQKHTRVVFMDLRQPPVSTKTLRKNIDFFNPAFIALQGSPEQLARLGKQLGMNAQRLASQTTCAPDEAVVALVGPTGYLQALFTGVTSPVDIAHDLIHFK